MTKHAGEQRAALVDRPRADAGLQPVRLPCTEQRDRDLAERDVIEPWRDVDGVRVGVSLSSRLREKDAVFACPALCDPLPERRTAPGGQLLHGERPELSTACDLPIPCVGVLSAAEGATAVAPVLAPPDFVRPCSVLATDGMNAHTKFAG